MKKILFLLIFVLQSFNSDATVNRTIDGVQFDKTVFASGDDDNMPVLYCGSKSEITDSMRAPFALTRITLDEKEAIARGLATTMNTSDGGDMTDEQVSQGLAMLREFRGGDGDGDEDDHPLSGKRITNLTLLNKKFPVVTAGDSLTVHVMTDPATGNAEKVISTTEINDAGVGENAAAIDNPIVSIAASSSNIFALVPAQGHAFNERDGVNRGVALIEYSAQSGENPAELTVKDASDLSATGVARARKLDLTIAANTVAFVDNTVSNAIAGARIGNVAAMHWDENLQRLYIGLSDVSRDDNNKEGGVLSVVMGFIDANANRGNGALRLLPVVNGLKKELFFDVATPNVKDRAIGFYYDGTTPRGTSGAVHSGSDNISVSIPHIKTMNTSTGRNYLIVNSVIASNPQIIGANIFIDAEDWIYALPLTSEAVDGAQEAKGVIAKVDADGVVALNDNAFQLPQAFGDMPTIAHAPVQVGGGNPISGAKVRDVFVVGDTVYVGLVGDKNQELGIFASSAVFNKDGFIVGWTPAKRVMGSAQAVVGGGLDAKTGNYYFLSQQGGTDASTATLVNTGKITVWGQSQASLSGDDETKSLSTVLEGLGSQETGGVHKLVSFDENTPGFEAGKFSMMAVAGFGSIALIQTGGFEGGDFKPVTQFTTQDVSDADGNVTLKNVFTFSGQAIQDISPISSIAIAKGTTNTKVYVGGFGGVAVLDLPIDLNRDKLAMATTTFSRFAGITQPTFAVGTGNNNVFALTRDGLKVSDLGGTPVTDTAVAKPSDMIVATGSTNAHALIADGTTVRSTNAAGSPLNLFGQVVQLQYVSQETGGVASTPGMLYAFVLGPRVEEVEDISENEELDPEAEIPMKKIRSEEVTVPQLYRIAVDASGVLSLMDEFDNTTDKLTGAKPFLQLEEARSNFFTDGSVFFNTHPKSKVFSDFVRLATFSKDNSFETLLAGDQLFDDVDVSITDDLDLEDASFYVGTVLTDPVLGKRIIAGDWGIRVNE